LVLPAITASPGRVVGAKFLYLGWSFGVRPPTRRDYSNLGVTQPPTFGCLLKVAHRMLVTQPGGLLDKWG